MCGLDRSSGFGGCRLQHPPKPPTVFGARCVSRSPMKYLKHVLKLHVQYLPKYSYTRYIHPLLARTRSPKYNKAQSKRKANPERRIHQSIVGNFRWFNMSQGVQNSISVPLDRCGFGGQNIMPTLRHDGFKIPGQRSHPQ